MIPPLEKTKPLVFYLGCFRLYSRTSRAMIKRHGAKE
jgi:hypothetical protein